MLPRAQQVIQGEGLIYMVLEYGDIDLARLLARHEAHRREGGATELDENFIRLYWQQMLQVPSLTCIPLLLTCPHDPICRRLHMLTKAA